ncbi:MAG: membrane protein insertion efficiency factor YidD [bacterium]|nr:membrane protein insertion efficiency factor YidD [bacterium]
MSEQGTLSRAQRAALAAIGFYRKWLSPLKPASCRFLPTCSVYAGEAIAGHGFSRGARLVVRRVLRCHPWHPAAYDPVPQPEGGKALELAGADRAGRPQLPLQPDR